MRIYLTKFSEMIQFLLLTLCLILSMNSKSFAQDGDIDALVDDTKNDLLIVVGGGLAGAILGLSTLSFVEEPKEHTRNIVVGASIGIIGAVGYVAFSQATKSQELIYGAPAEEGANIKFNTKERRQWHASNNKTPVIATPYNFSMSFAF